MNLKIMPMLYAIKGFVGEEFSLYQPYQHFKELSLQGRGGYLFDLFKDESKRFTIGKNTCGTFSLL